MDLVGVKIPDSNDVLWAKKATGFDVENDLVVLEVSKWGREATHFRRVRSSTRIGARQWSS